MLSRACQVLGDHPNSNEVGEVAVSGTLQGRLFAGRPRPAEIAKIGQKRGGDARRGTESPSLVERGEPGLQAGPWEEGIFPVKKIFFSQKTFLTQKS